MSFLDSRLHVSVPDTELAIRYTPDPKGYVGTRILPMRPVRRKNDLIRRINKANLIQKRDLRVGAKGSVAEVQFRLDAEDNYFAIDYAVSAIIDFGEAAQADSILQYEEEQRITAIEAMHINVESIITENTLRDTAVMTNNRTLNATEFFNDYNATGDGPFRILRNAIMSVVLATGGKDPTSITMHRWTWSHLSEHPDLLGKAPVHTDGAGLQKISPEQFLRIFDLDPSKCELNIVGGYYTSSNEGDPVPTFQSFIGRDIVINYTEPQGPRSFGLGYTHAWAGPGQGGEPLKGADGNVLSMVVYRVPLPDWGSHGGERIKVVGSFDAKVHNPDAGFLIKNALDPALSLAFL